MKIRRMDLKEAAANQYAALVGLERSIELERHLHDLVRAAVRLRGARAARLCDRDDQRLEPAGDRDAQAARPLPAAGASGRLMPPPIHPAVRYRQT